LLHIGYMRNFAVCSCYSWYSFRVRNGGEWVGMGHMLLHIGYMRNAHENLST